MSGRIATKANGQQACAIYNQCAVAMKREDPTIKVGPAIEWPNQGGVIQPLLQQWRRKRGLHRLPLLLQQRADRFHGRFDEQSRPYG